MLHMRSSHRCTSLMKRMSQATRMWPCPMRLQSQETAQTQQPLNYTAEETKNNIIVPQIRSSDSNAIEDTSVTILHYPFAADEPTTAFSYAFSEEEEEENEGECKSDEEEAVALRHALAEARVFVVASSSAGKIDSSSADDVVARTIARVRPDIVLVALSATRLLTIEPNTVAAELLMKKANFASTGFLNEFTKKPIMEKAGVVRRLLDAWLLAYLVRTFNKLEMVHGEAFKSAYNAARRLDKDCELVLGDWPLDIALVRAFVTLSFRQRLRFYRAAIVSMFAKRNSRQTAEASSSSEGLALPQTSHMLATERDMYTTGVLHNLLLQATFEKYGASRRDNKAPFEPVIGVAVVGANQVAEIRSNWRRRIDCAALTEIPERSVAAQIGALLVDAALCTGIAYGAYRLAMAGMGSSHRDDEPLE